jgi:hypothetical protein
MTIGSGDRTIQTAIDADHCTADVVSVRTRKIGDGGGNLFRSSRPPMSLGIKSRHAPASISLTSLQDRNLNPREIGRPFRLGL